MSKYLEELDKRARKAHEDGRGWRALWDDLYTYALPNRRPAQQSPKTEGQTNDMVFDATATRAAFRFAGRVQRDAVPPFQSFVELKVGPAGESLIALQSQGNKDTFRDIKQGLERDLETWAKLGHDTLEGSNFALASAECFIDYFGGQAALLMLENEENIVEFVAVPAVELALRENGKGKVCGIYWTRKFRAGDLPHEWPDPKFSVDMNRRIKESPEDQVPITQACEYDTDTGKWNICVYRPDALNDPEIHESVEPINPMADTQVL